MVGEYTHPTKNWRDVERVEPANAENWWASTPTVHEEERTDEHQYEFDNLPA